MTDKPVVNEKLLDLLKKVYEQGCYDTEPYGERKEEMTPHQVHDQIIELFRECLPKKKELKEYFEANYLDGDKIQGGQMIASSECFEAIQQAITEAEKKIGGER